MLFSVKVYELSIVLSYESVGNLVYGDDSLFSIVKDLKNNYERLLRLSLIRVSLRVMEKDYYIYTFVRVDLLLYSIFIFSYYYFYILYNNLITYFTSELLTQASC